MASSASLSSAIRIPATAASKPRSLLRPPHRLPSRASGIRCLSQQSTGGSQVPRSQRPEPSLSPSPSSSTPTEPSQKPRNSLSPHWQRLSSIAAQRSQLSPRLRSELTRLGERWNMYSGYDQIESAKIRVIDSENRLEALRAAQNEAKSRYVSAVTRRSTSQKTINDLLSRKASWSDEDLIKYTSLLRAEHAEAREEEVAREEFDTAERDVGKAWDEVVKRTLERYHDEQIWSDRVRNVSSYTQLAVVGLNVFIFALAILVVEPYKRRKLAETFETRLLKGEEQGRIALEGVIHRFDQSVQSLSEELQDLKEGQQGLLTVAGVSEKERSQKRKSIGDIAEESMGQTSETSSPEASSGRRADEHDQDEQRGDLISMAKRRTRFLHSPKTEAEQERRTEVAVATGLGAFFGAILWAGLFRSP